MTRQAPPTRRAGSKEKAAVGERPSRPARVPFPRKNRPPSEAEFVARLPLALGKRLESVRAFLKKHDDVTEDLFFYGPKTGWAFRYLRGSSSLATVMLHEDRLVGLVALDAQTLSHVDFHTLSEVGQRAHAQAHGSPSLLWLDLPLDGRGGADFKTLLKRKLKSLPAVPAPAAAPPAPAPGPTSRSAPPTATAPPPRRPPPPPPRRPPPPPPPPPPRSARRGKAAAAE